MSSITLEIGPELTERLEEEARKEGLAPNDYVVRLLQGLLGPSAPAASDPVETEPEKKRPSWQLAAELLNGAPEEELERLPADLSHNFDHYLYGAPKR